MPLARSHPAGKSLTRAMATVARSRDDGTYGSVAVSHFPRTFGAPGTHQTGGIMAIAVQIDVMGATLRDYDRAMEIAGFLPGGPLPEGGLFHWVTDTNDGIRIVNVWTSRDAFDDFSKTQADLLEEIGIDPTALNIEFFEVHNYLGTGLRG